MNKKQKFKTKMRSYLEIYKDGDKALKHALSDELEERLSSPHFARQVRIVADKHYAEEADVVLPFGAGNRPSTVG